MSAAGQVRVAPAGIGNGFPGGFPAPVTGDYRSTYRFGRLAVSLQTDDAAFERRFFHVFSDCRESPDASASAALQARVAAADGDWFDVALGAAGALRLDAEVLPALLPELGLIPTRSAVGLSGFARGHEPECIVAHATAHGVRLHRTLPWQILAGHWLVHQVLRQQHDLVYLHAATVAVSGAGVLLCGDKGAGKSTLALTLAGRGHGFLGDEVAALDPVTRACVPFRRSVSVRSGPLGANAAAQLAALSPGHEVLADGTTRTRAPVSQLFPQALVGEVPLRAVFFLGTRGAWPTVEAFRFGSAHLAALEPMQASFTGAPPGRRAMQLLQLLSDLPCHRLAPGGSPDDTAALIERTLEAVWA